MTHRPYLVGLVGAGVTPSLTPKIHMAEARELGLAYVYRTVDILDHGIAPTDIGEVLRFAWAFGFDALNVTHPCKQVAVAYVDRLDPAAARVGAINTVLFTDDGCVGYNTDHSGFATAFATGLPQATKDVVVQIGAGGAGAAVADALLESGVETLTIVDRDGSRAAALAADVARRFPNGRVHAGSPDELPVLLAPADGLVHCTPMGMAEHPGLPLDPELLHPGLWVADIVYRPLETALLAAARAAGCRVLHGGHMAVHQAAETLRIITGRQPDVARMLATFPLLAESGPEPLADNQRVR